MENSEIIYIMEKINQYGWFLLIIFIERLFPNRAYNLHYKGIVSDIFHTFDPLIKPFIIVSGISFLNYIFPQISNGFFKIPSHWPIWLHIPFIIIISEMSFYWIHRLVHKNKYLWQFHRVHHSSTMYQSIMTSRFHPIDSSLFVIPYILLITLLDINIWVVSCFGLFQGLMDKYGHSNINGPRWTGYFISNPHFHAWHHSNDYDAIDKNFSRDFVFLDYIFKTAYFPKDLKPTSFGDVNYPTNFIVQLYTPLLNILKILKKNNV